MSRFAKKPIDIPKGVDIKIDGQMFRAKGTKGELSYEIHEMVTTKIENNQLTVMPKDVNKKSQTREQKFLDSILGTMRSILNSVVIGVSAGFEKKLLMVGVGYRGQMQGNILNLSLGYSHPVVFKIPEGITIEMPTPTEIIVKGVNKHLVGQAAANIKAKRPVEPYKGKGIRYADERISLKEVKKK